MRLTGMLTTVYAPSPGKCTKTQVTQDTDVYGNEIAKMLGNYVVKKHFGALEKYLKILACIKADCMIMTFCPVLQHFRTQYF